MSSSDAEQAVAAAARARDERMKERAMRARWLVELASAAFPDLLAEAVGREDEWSAEAIERATRQAAAVAISAAAIFADMTSAAFIGGIKA